MLCRQHCTDLYVTDFAIRWDGSKTCLPVNEWGAIEYRAWDSQCHKWKRCTSRLCHSSTQHLLDHVARHAVEEQRYEHDQQQEDDDFQDEPAIVVPEDVSDRLEWIHEPNERRIRPTAAQTISNIQLLGLLRKYSTSSKRRVGHDTIQLSLACGRQWTNSLPHHKAWASASAVIPVFYFRFLFDVIIVSGRWFQSAYQISSELGGIIAS